MSDGGTPGKGNGNTCAHLGGLWARNKNIKDSQLSARLYKYKSGQGRDTGHTIASEHGVKGLEGRTDWREFTVQDMCGLGYELNQRNINAECWGDSPTITFSPTGKPMEVKELRDKDVRADGTKGPYGRILCDIGEYTLADGTVKRGNDHTRCCRPRQPGLSIPFSEKYGTPECNSKGACKSGGVAASIQGSPRSVSAGGYVRGAGNRMIISGTTRERPDKSNVAVSGYDVFKYGYEEPYAESSCHLYLIDSCANATPYGKRGCQIRFEEKNEGGEWFGYKCDWWDADGEGPGAAQCYSKEGMANSNIYRLDPSETVACNCFDRTGEFAIPCGDYFHNDVGVGTDENVIEATHVKGYTSSGNAQIGTTAITSGNQWYIPYTSPSSGKILKFKHSTTATTEHRLLDPRARIYPDGTHNNVKKARGHIQGVGSGRYIGQYSPCREASNAGQHGCPDDVDTAFWGS